MKKLLFAIVALCTISVTSCSKAEEETAPLQQESNKALAISFDVAEQQSVAKYEIMFSTDGKEFKKVAEIPSDNKTETSYFVDIALAPYIKAGNTQVMWKIRSVDIDLKTLESAVTTAKF